MRLFPTALTTIASCCLSLNCSPEASLERTGGPDPDVVRVDHVNGSVEKQDEHTGRKPIPSPEVLAQLPPDGGPDYNRLVFEQSPYLLQHAGNPIDWYPYGEEAFEAARSQDKPIFLSIGYSACHWCHVMEKESFEDDEVAAHLNANYICIKVDREERPDIDHVYMSVTQAMTGSGGWPMTVIMTPELKPFFAGTYFPKNGRFGRKGMMQFLPEISKAWADDRAKVDKTANEVSSWMQSIKRGNPGDDLGPKVLDLAFQQLSRNYDPEEGGFGAKAPKFPMPHTTLFLLQYHQRTGNARALGMSLKTLRKMRLGGIFDHVGFGFHRYSTDQHWLVPHFEKMLYDQALLVMAYTAAFQITGEDEFRRTAEQVIEYVLRDMTSPEGGFYSAEDADSEGEEGLFYLWTTAELEAILGEDAELFIRTYNAADAGNFRDEASGTQSANNILHLSRAIDPESEDGLRLEAARKRLFDEREKRVHCFKDDKVLTDWNGLMLAALARAAQAFDDPKILAAARRAADFALSTLRDENGRLFKRYRMGQAGLPGTLEDYAFLTWGLIDVYEATFDVRYLRSAIELTDTMIAHFADDENGGFFMSADDETATIVRGKEAYDGAIPSGNSVAAWNLLRLARITGRTQLEELAAGTFRSHSGTVAKNPSAHTQLLAALDFAFGPSYEIVIAGDPAAEDTQAMLRGFRSRFVPHKVLLQRPLGEAPPITELSPFTLSQSTKKAAVAYVCLDYACKLPTTDLETALSFLDPASWRE